MPCCKNVDAGRETVCGHSYHLPLHIRPLAPFSFPFLVCIIYISRLSTVLYLRCTSLVGRWSFPHHWPSAHCSHQSVNPTLSLVSPSPSDLLTPLFQIPKLEIRNPSSLLLCLDPLRTSQPLTLSGISVEPSYPSLPPLFPKGWLIGNGWIQSAAILEKRVVIMKMCRSPCKPAALAAPFLLHTKF